MTESPGLGCSFAESLSEEAESFSTSLLSHQKDPHRINEPISDLCPKSEATGGNLIYGFRKCKKGKHHWVFIMEKVETAIFQNLCLLPSPSGLHEFPHTVVDICIF